MISEDIPAKIPAKPHWTERSTPAWARTSQRILSERGRRCEWCGSDYLVHVHHKTYERFGNELDEDLVVLCTTCHTREHARLNFELRREEHDAAWAEVEAADKWRREEFVRRTQRPDGG